MKQQRLRVGVILKPQGIRGEVKIQPLTDDSARFEGLTEVYLETETQTKPVKLIVNRIEPQAVYAYLEGCHSRDTAETLRGAYLSVDREQAAELPEGSWFICELEGMEVYVDGEPAGQLVEVIATGGVDVYQVRRKDGTSFYFPALKRVLAKVDVENNRMDLDGRALGEVAVDED